MRITNMLLVLGFIPCLAVASRGDTICQTWLKEGAGNQILTPAISGDIQDKPADLAICYQGKDYSRCS